ncbi:MAG: hypothetical protein KIC51_06385 [Acetobacter sp.]|nr:hypothetical protein [Acetobacter sp.]
MKKKYAILFCFLIAAVGIAGYALRRQERHPGQATAAAQVVAKNAENTHNKTGSAPDVSAVRKIYINVNSIKISPFFRDMQELAQALRKTGTEVVLSGKGSFATGDFNLYAADNIGNLPEVADRNAINVLWLPMVQGSDDAARLRSFDVVVVKSIAAFGHLKAINVRTAYIPDAINIKNPANRRPNNKAMFYGDNRGFSLPLYLAGRADMSVDVYGKGFENVWPTDEIMPDTPQPEDFQTYSAVLLDQSDEAVRDELVSPQVIEVIENGGLPAGTGTKSGSGSAAPSRLARNGETMGQCFTGAEICGNFCDYAAKKAVITTALNFARIIFSGVFSEAAF